MNKPVSLFSRGGCKDGFEALLAPHIKALHRQAWHYTGNTQDAEDLLQDLLLDLYMKQAQMAEIENLPAWLNRCLYHRFVDHHRRQQRAPRCDNIDTDSVQSSLAQPDQCENAYLHQQLMRAMQHLSPVQRAVVSLHDVSGHTLPELAEIMDLPLGTLKSHLHRARNRLKSALELQPLVVAKRRYK